MRGRYKRKDTKGRTEETGEAAGLSPPSGETATGSGGPDSPVSGVAVRDAVGGKGKTTPGSKPEDLCYTPFLLVANLFHD